MNSRFVGTRPLASVPFPAANSSFPLCQLSNTAAPQSIKTPNVAWTVLRGLAYQFSSQPASLTLIKPFNYPVFSELKVLLLPGSINV